MKSVTSIILVIVFIGTGYGQSPSKTEADSRAVDLDEAARLSAEAIELFNQGKAEAALPIAVKALKLREKHLKDSEILVRVALSNAAELYISQRKYNEAVRLLKRMIASYENRPTDVGLALVSDRLAVIYYSLGRFSEAEELYKRALEVREANFGEKHPAVAESLFRLAEFYHFIGKYKQAGPYYERSVTIWENFPERKNSLDETLDRYSCLMRKLERNKEAEDLEARWYGPSPGMSREELPTLENLLNGRALSLPAPHYPDEARAARALGTVIVRVYIGENGKVLRACALKGHPLLLRTSELAAYRATFVPTKISGMPVRVFGVISYNYVVR